MNPVKILIAQEVYNQGQRYIDEYSEDGLENGYSLFGLIHSNKVYEVTKIVAAGPKSKRSGVSFSPDEETIGDELGKEIQMNTNLRWLGDNHSHPWRGDPTPSGTDIGQLLQAREKRPWTFIGVHSLDRLKFFGVDENEKPVELPYQIIPDGFDEKRLLSRISEITDSEILKQKKVAILGCGSLSCGVIQSLAGTGLRNFVLGDMDSLADANIVRHIGGIYDLKKDKTEILKEYIESHNPLAAVQTIADDFLKNRELLRSVVNWADIVIASSGNPALNYQINLQCFKFHKPVVFGGIYDRAESAYVFYYDPKEQNRACFDCIFELTSAAIDNNTIKRKYGLDDGELKEAQGMFADILVPGAMMGNIAIKLMMGKTPECNLLRYYNSLKTERINVSQKKGCATCDYVNWVKKEESKLDEKNQNLFGQFCELNRKLWRIFGFDF